MRLAGRIVLVTGAARGLGKAIAVACAKDGAAVAMCDILENEGRSVESELRSAGADALFVSCDITRPADIASLAEQIDARWGRLDGLVNNAALATRLAGKGFDEIEEADWDRVFQINVKGTWMVTRAMAHLLRAGKSARIVNMASDTALWGGDMFLHYVSSKAAIIGMTRGLARELGREGIAVNAVAPGLTETEATAAAPERRWAQYREGQVLAQRATPAHIAATVTFLLSSDAAHIAGQTLAVNGGMTLN